MCCQPDGATWASSAALARTESHAALAFLCVQSLDEASEEQRRIVFDFLERRVGHAL